MPHPIPAPRESGYTGTTEHPLYWVSYGPPDASRLLILHGGPGADHEYLLPQMLHLAERYNCYFYDQRGGGKSRVESNVDHPEVTWQTHVDDLGKVALELGIAPLSIVGFSWGSMLALLYTLSNLSKPNHPKRLVLINPAPLTKAYKTEFDANMAARRVENPPGGTDKQKAFENAVAGYFARPEMAHHLTPFRVIGRVQQSVWNSLIENGDYDVLKHLSSIGTLEIPVLVTHGDRDPIPVESSERAARALNAEFVLIPNCGHVPYVEEPEKLWAAVDSFLEKTD